MGMEFILYSWIQSLIGKIHSSSPHNTYRSHNSPIKVIKLQPSGLNNFACPVQVYKYQFYYLFCRSTQLQRWIRSFHIYSSTIETVFFLFEAGGLFSQKQLLNYYSRGFITFPGILAWEPRLRRLALDPFQHLMWFGWYEACYWILPHK